MNLFITFHVVDTYVDHALRLCNNFRESGLSMIKKRLVTIRVLNSKN